MKSLQIVDIEQGPQMGAVLEWSNINYTVAINVDDKSATSRTLLSSMSGRANPGEILAIMGQSGAGKSTLLDVLSGRLESTTLSGQLFVNGVAADNAIFRKQTGYVMQTDALFPLLTVRESIRFAAALRCKNKSEAEKEEAVDDIIRLLRLETCADTRIGDEDVRGVSGGEKRRVSIAVDLVHKPSIVFLDEPTSGLVRN